MVCCQLRTSETMAAVLIEMPVADVLILVLSFLQVSPCWRWAMVLNSPEHPRDVGHWAVGPSASATGLLLVLLVGKNKTKHCMLSGVMTSLSRSGPVNSRGFQTASGPNISASQRTCRVCIVLSYFLNSAFQKRIPF